MAKNYTNILLVALIIVLILIGASKLGLFSPNKTTDTNKSDDLSRPSIEDEFVEVNDEIRVTEEGIKYLVDPNKISGGGPPKGGIGVEVGIPSLAGENINFVTVDEADQWIGDNELVLALVRNGVKRVYPLQILVWHEIVNDEINGEPILITYCPLCGSGIAYERTIVLNGEITETRFGTSGKLFNSNLVMYDEATDTYWQQIDGKAIVGDLVGQELNEISIDTVVWLDWKAVHPDSEVLSQETGMNRDYGRDPYGSYYEDSFLIFPVDGEDSRLHPKDIVFGIEVDGVHKAYREVDLKELGAIEDIVNGVGIKVERDQAGIVEITNLNSSEEIIKERDMWFAWYAFHPETELWESQSPTNLE